jgi:hypothetical protein
MPPLNSAKTMIIYVGFAASLVWLSDMEKA